MNEPRVGLWLVGAYGSVAATATLGLSAYARGLHAGVGMVTDLPALARLPLHAPSTFVVGGHDVRRASFLDTTTELHLRSNIFSHDLLKACASDLEDWSANVRPGVVVHGGPGLAALVDPERVRSVRSCREAVEAIRSDLAEFRDRHRLAQIVVVNVASTEPPFPLGDEHRSLNRLRPALDRTSAFVLPASSLYALAAIESGVPYINFTPSLGFAVPAIEELAVERRVPLAGKDGKTGETLLKTVLAPLFALRHLRVLSWVGHNILGCRDGQVLADPLNKAGKVHTKDAVLSEILGYKPQTHVSIEYIESLDDWKTAWDHVHFEGFLGTKMTLQFTWQGCDAILAAPLVLDLARLTLLAQRRGEVGTLSHLACFFKSPHGVAEHDFFKQYALLADYVAKVSAT